jgi:DNA polymerase
VKLITLDFETYYDPDNGYTLSKMTTEAYIRDPRFEAILCTFTVDDGPVFDVDGLRLKEYLPSLELHKHGVIMHHAHFDAGILYHHYGISPKAMFCTLGMGRALHGANGRLSLEKLSERYGLPPKGHEVQNVKGMRRADFSPEAYQRYARYGHRDSLNTRSLAQIMMPQFSRSELQIHDKVIRMFTEPKLVLNAPLLQEYADQLNLDKTTLMLRAGAQKEDLMSNDKFAQLLIDRGVEPPTQVSAATGKTTWAFAKTGAGMQALAEHPDEDVQALVAARTGVKSTMAETRANRFIGMASRGGAMIYLKYSGASGTHRLSGGDGTNAQNLTRGSKLRDAFEAPDGKVIVVCDSSNIDARVLDTIAGQVDMVQAYRDYDNKVGPDIYCIMAEKIYKHPVNKKEHPRERQMGKVAKLGLGYGLAGQGFQVTVRAQAKDDNGKPLVLPLTICNNVVEIYRESHAQVQKLWKRMDNALDIIASKLPLVPVDYQGIIKTCEDGLMMPNGLKILFPDLKREKDKDTGRMEWTFWNGKTREKIYGAKMTGIVTQCLARIVVLDQSLAASKELGELAPWVHSVHDEALFVTDVFEAPYVQDIVERNFRTAPAWLPALPLNCESGFHQSYGKAKP